MAVSHSDHRHSRAFTTAIVATSSARVRKLEVRERNEMIEKGLVPPPEVDPHGFDRAMDRYDRYSVRAPRRHRSAGVTLMGVGFGLMVLIAFAGESPSSALGVGGFLVVIGLAFFLNSLFDRNDPSMPPAGPRSGPVEPRRHPGSHPGPRRYGVQSVLIHPVLPIM